jgi:hypothetical protein
MRFHIVIFITLMEIAAGTLELLMDLEEIHLHGASSLHGIGIFDGDIWWRSFTSLWWMVMVDGLLMVLGGTFMSLLDGSLS